MHGFRNITFKLSIAGREHVSVGNCLMRLGCVRHCVKILTHYGKDSCCVHTVGNWRDDDDCTFASFELRCKGE